MTTVQTSPVLHVTLPRAATLTDVLLSPPGPPVDPGEMRRAREHLVAELRGATSGLRRGQVLRIDAYRIHLALTSPGQGVSPDGPFSPSPASCRRAIGSAAVSHCLRDRALAPAQAVERVLERTVDPRGSERGSVWWEEWFRSIPPGARAVVQSEAVIWATQLYGALEWSRIERQIQVGSDYRWECPGSTRVTLHAKADVRAWTHDRPVLLVMHTGIAGPRWSSMLALAALAAGLVSGADSVPARVVGMWPASGQVRILPVESGTLDDASKSVIQAARALTQHRAAS
jgi:hypothetical protein